MTLRSQFYVAGSSNDWVGGQADKQKGESFLNWISGRGAQRRFLSDLFVFYAQPHEPVERIGPAKDEVENKK